MRTLLLALLAALFTGLATYGQPLSDEAEISLMTSDPHEGEVFTIYGHAALRVKDPAQRIDYIFNYGIFSFDKPNFIYRFTKGETDYQLGVTYFENYIAEYQMAGSDVTEQVLNLTPAEKQRVWKALLENYRPENRVYRYNFFFDNCATRPAAITERNIDGTSRPLVARVQVIQALEVDEPERDLWDTLTPNVCFSLLLALVALSVGMEYKRKRYCRWIDVGLFLMAGLAGCLLFFLSFISEHPCTCPNWMLVALHPLHLVAAILFGVKRMDKVGYYYHFINFAALSMMLAAWPFIPQHLNTAFLPIVASLWLRSGWAFSRSVWIRK